MSWISCSCEAGRHWGHLGAAGLIVANGLGDVLLQRRSGWVHHGGTWAIPGGALNAGESAVDAALREAHEEMGAPRNGVTVREVVETRCSGGWAYHTVLAWADPGFALHPGSETAGVDWVPVGEVAGMDDLHPGFEASWPKVKAALTAGPEPVRAWRVNLVSPGGVLLNPFEGVESHRPREPVPQIAVSTCSKDRTHVPPAPRCECGVYACDRLDALYRIADGLTKVVDRNRQSVRAVLVRGWMHDAVRWVHPAYDAPIALLQVDLMDKLAKASGRGGLAALGDGGIMLEGKDGTVRGSRFVSTDLHVPGEPALSDRALRGLRNYGINGTTWGGADLGGLVRFMDQHPELHEVR